MKTDHKFELKFLALVLVTVAVTTVAWFGVRYINNNNASKLMEARKAQLSADSKDIPMGTAVEVKGRDFEDKDSYAVDGWTGTMEFTVTGATLYQNLEDFKTSDESLYAEAMQHEPLSGAVSSGFSPCVLVVDLTASNKDATATEDMAPDSASYLSSCIKLGEFRMGIGNRVVSTLATVDGCIDSQDRLMWSCISIKPGETKQVRLVFCFITAENYDEVTAGDTSFYGESPLAPVYGQYVCEEGDTLTLCLGSSGLSAGQDSVNYIPFVFELNPEQLG